MKRFCKKCGDLYSDDAILEGVCTNCTVRRVEHAHEPAPSPDHRRWIYVAMVLAIVAFPLAGGLDHVPTWNDALTWVHDKIDTVTGDSGGSGVRYCQLRESEVQIEELRHAYKSLYQYAAGEWPVEGSATPIVPRSMQTFLIRQMQPGEDGWVFPWHVSKDSNGNAYLNENVPAIPKRQGTQLAHVFCESESRWIVTFHGEFASGAYSIPSYGGRGVPVTLQHCALCREEP